MTEKRMHTIFIQGHVGHGLQDIARAAPATVRSPMTGRKGVALQL